MKSMLSLHLASLRSGRHFLAVCAFVFVMLCISMGYAGWLDSASDSIHAGWVLLLLWNYAGMAAIAYKDNGKSEFFLAIGRIQKWALAAIAAHFLISLCFIAIWTLWMGIQQGWNELLGVSAAVMALFSAIFAQSALGNLQIKLIGQTPAKKMALMTVVSAPWALIAWILGLFACRQTALGESPVMFVLALVLLGIFQVILGLFSRNEAAQRRTKYQDKQ